MWCFLINRVIQEEGLYVYFMHNTIVENLVSALHPSQAGSVVMVKFENI
jgi:hypothetical protein